MNLHKKIINHAQKCGSKSTQINGATHFIHKFLEKKNWCGWSFEKPKKLEVSAYKMHKWLDSGSVGSVAPNETVEKTYGYSFASCSDYSYSLKSLHEARRNNPRKKNLSYGESRIYGSRFQERFETIYYKGRFRGYTGSNLFADYQSCFAVSESGKTAVRIGGCQLLKRVKAPAGMVWSIDNLGLRLIRKDGIDFHVDKVLFHNIRISSVVNAEMTNKWKTLQLNKKNQKFLEKYNKIKNREIQTTRVTLNDSRMAGNCIEGSLAFAEKRLGIPRSEVLNGGYLFSVPAAKLIKLKDNLAMKAVDKAWLRETTISI
jgi:hypothetical protein